MLNKLGYRLNSSKKLVRYLSDSVNKQNKVAALICNTTVDKIDNEDVGSFFPIDEKFRSIFPEGLAGEYEGTQNFKRSKKHPEHYMIRKSDVTLLDEIRNISSQSSAACTSILVSFVEVDGERGTGKSLSLNLGVALARNLNYLTLFIPHPRHWLTETHHLENGTGTAQPAQRSELTPNFFSQGLGAQKILRNIETNHKDLLMSLDQKREYDHQYYKQKLSGKGTGISLHTIVLRGLRDVGFAANCVYDLRQELGLVQEVPVMIAVDELNYLYWPSAFYAQGEHIPTYNLLLPKSFRCINEDGEIIPEQRLKNGIILAATSKEFKVPFSGYRELADKRKFYPENDPYLPFDLEGNPKKLLGFDKCVSSENFSSSEFRRFFGYSKKMNAANRKNMKKNEDSIDLEYYYGEADKKYQLEAELEEDHMYLATSLNANPEKLQQTMHHYV
eukprot:maker-scaffold_20-snap-gene-3.42-mRNA-1 protein AED:0.01 eAED:0.01 QI:339/0.6/0.66/1/1/1/6/61/445